jgi:hypothetical protein
MTIVSATLRNMMYEMELSEADHCHPKYISMGLS